MKSWLLYFFAILISLFSVTAVTPRLYGSAAPTLRVSLNGQVKSITVEEYALLALLAQADNCPQYQVKKALAVAARSAGLYFSAFGCNHKNFDCCDNPNCCIALGNISFADEQQISQCKRAVAETAGYGLFYNNLPALSLFCICNGSGSAPHPTLEYLEGIKNSSRCTLHKQEKQHPYTSLTPMLLKNTTYSDFTTNTLLVYDDYQKCSFGILAGKRLSAKEIISGLGLSSAEFYLSYTQSGIASVAYGFGQGYGMSLCAAQELASNQADWQSILKHFYPKLVLKKSYTS